MENPPPQRRRVQRAGRIERDRLQTGNDRTDLLVLRQACFAAEHHIGLSCGHVTAPHEFADVARRGDTDALTPLARHRPDVLPRLGDCHVLISGVGCFEQ